MPKLTDAEITERVTRSFLRVVNRIHLGRRTPIRYGSNGTTTFVEAEMCVLLAHREGVTGSQISEHLGVTRSATSQLITKLVNKGLVRRKSDPGNAKRKLLYLTTSGKKVTDMADDYNKQMSRELYDTSRHELLAYLRFMTKLEAFHSRVRSMLRDEKKSTSANAAATAPTPRRRSTPAK